MSVDSIDLPPSADAPEAEPLLDINGNPITPGLSAAGDASQPAPPDAEPPAAAPAGKKPGAGPPRRSGQAGGPRPSPALRSQAASPASGYAALPDEEEARFDLAGNPLPPKPANDTSPSPTSRAPVPPPRRAGPLRDPGAERPAAGRGILGLILVILALGAVFAAWKMLPARLHPEAQAPAAVSAPAKTPSNAPGNPVGKSAPSSPFH